MIRLGCVSLVCGVATIALPAQTAPAQTPPAQTPPAQTLDQCRSFRHHGKLPEAQSCFARLAAGSNPYARAEGLWALEQYQEANDQFKALVKQEPKNALYRVRWGLLFLERFNPNEAGNLFNEALEIDKDNAQAYLGLARVAAENYGGKAVDFAQKAAKLDPKLAEPHELLAFMALEDNDEERAAKEADQALAISNEALDAMAIHAVIDWLDDKAETPHLENPWIDKVLKVNPAYGEAYSTAGHFFVLNRRYTEGIKFYRKALDLNPRLWDARAELGVNLMRLGQEGEARSLLEQCYNANYKSAEVVNTLRLIDSYANFNIYETNRTTLRVAK